MNEAVTKSHLRKIFRTRRRHITSEDRQQAALAAAALFVEQPFFKKSLHIACYLATKDEFDCLPIIKAIWQAKKQCYLPVLSTQDQKILRFVRYNEGDSLHINHYSILEPINGLEVITPEKLDLVVAPLVAFDLHGHRLGAGGGYYDRTFAFLQDEKNKVPCMMGLAYAAQFVDELPFDSWDIALDGAVTEEKAMFFNKTVIK